MALIVDGMNVIGAGADGWWRDRAGARRRLVAQLAPLAADGTEVTVVFDGRGSGAPESGQPGTLRVLYAPGGPNAADGRIVEIVRALPHPQDTVVVTSDRELARAVSALGARVEGVRTFRSRLAAP